jgi:hypothetical protein
MDKINFIKSFLIFMLMFSLSSCQNGDEGDPLSDEELSTQTLPIDEATVNGTPDEEVSTQSLPAEESAGEATSDKELPTQTLPTDDATGNDTPDEDPSTLTLPAEESSGEGTPDEDLSTQTLPFEKAEVTGSSDEDPIILDLSDGTVVYPEDPIILDISVSHPPLNTGLSAEYSEYYSGYWKGSLCGGNEQAVIGIDNNSVELNTNASFMNPVFGSIDLDGELLFPPRQVNWDTETYGVVRDLDTSGVIDRATGTGYINFEVACSQGSQNFTISAITINLKSGQSQLSPYNELFRIENQAIDLITSSVQHCTEVSQCKSFNIDESNSDCNLHAHAYSTSVIDENKLTELQNEYSRNKWLSTSSNAYSSTTTFCAHYYNATCEENICSME